MERIELTDESLIEVVNEYGGEVSYVTEKTRRVFPPSGVRKVPFTELKELILERGYVEAFERGILVVKDERAREALGLQPLSDYNLDESGIRKILIDGTEEELEDYLQYTSDGGIEKIVRVAIEIPLSSLRKINLIKAYSGKDILVMIQEMEDLKAQSVTSGPRKPVSGGIPVDTARKPKSV